MTGLLGANNCSDKTFRAFNRLDFHDRQYCHNGLYRAANIIFGKAEVVA